MDFSKNSVLFAAALSVLGLTFLIYSQGLSGAFLFDDHINLVSNERLIMDELTWSELWSASFSSDAGVLKRPISMMSFALNEYAAGMDPFYFKLTNLIIHLTNGAGIAYLGYLLLSAYRKLHQPLLSNNQIRWMALVIGAAWLLHPLNISSVLYVVQRMTSLATLFMIFGLIVYCKARLNNIASHQKVIPILLAYLLFTPMAVLSKENGALLPAYLFVIEFAIFQFQCTSVRNRNVLYAIHGAFLWIPAAVIIGWLAMNPNWLLAGYESRPFSLTERLLTESRVLWFYLLMMVLPNIQKMGIHHDDIALSTGFLEPITTIFAVFFLLLIFIISFSTRKYAPALTFSVLWFFAGHAMESTALPLEIAHEHRNYLPIFGVLFALLYYLGHVNMPNRINRYRTITIILFIGLLGINTSVRAYHWGQPLLHAALDVEHHPKSARTNYELGRLYYIAMENDPRAEYYSEAKKYFLASVKHTAYGTNGYFGLIQLSFLANQPIEDKWLRDFKQRLETPPFSADNFNMMIGLVNCQVAGRCALSHEEMEEIFRASLRNPTASNRARASFFRLFGKYIVYTQEDYAKALKLFTKAVDIYPKEISFRLDVIKVLVLLGDYEAAEKALNIASHYDKLNTYEKEISEITGFLIQHSLGNLSTMVH